MFIVCVFSCIISFYLFFLFMFNSKKMQKVKVYYLFFVKILVYIFLYVFMFIKIYIMIDIYIYIDFVKWFFFSKGYKYI